MDEPSSIDIGRLFCLASDVRAVTADWTTDPGWDGLSRVLADARAALGMDVAFVSRFIDGQRRFEVVSVSADSPASLQPGDSDPLLDTYCKLVADRTLPAALGDSWAYAPTAALDVTRRRALNFRPAAAAAGAVAARRPVRPRTRASACRHRTR